MFTGLIERAGEVLAVAHRAGGRRITIAAPGLVSRVNIGDSIAVSGVCLTALDIEPDAVPQRFSADLAAETIARTTLAHLREGSVVNLELPTPAGTPLGGHVVQGHVDGTGTLRSLEPISPGSPDTDWRLRVTIPEALSRYVVPQGSIAVEGISLTVAAVDGTRIEIAIIPHTYKATNLHTLTAGSAVNIEVDVLGKYAERRSRSDAGWALTEGYLLANGY